MTIGERIKKRRIKIKMTQEELAKYIDSTKQTIYKYENNIVTNIPSDKIEIMARALQTSPAYLMGWDVVNKYHSSVLIPVYGSIPAGVPLEAVEDIKGEIDIPTSWLTGDKKYIALMVKGDSMYPKYLSGDTVIVKLQSDCETGQDCACYVNGYEATLKRVELVNGNITLIPLNTNYSPRTYLRREVTILGIVKEIRREV